MNRTEDYTLSFFNAVLDGFRVKPGYGLLYDLESDQITGICAKVCRTDDDEQVFIHRRHNGVWTGQWEPCGALQEELLEAMEQYTTAQRLDAAFAEACTRADALEASGVVLHYAGENEDDFLTETGLLMGTPRPGVYSKGGLDDALDELSFVTLRECEYQENQV